MNIKDLPTNSYQPVSTADVGGVKLNINSLPQGSYTPVSAVNVGGVQLSLKQKADISSAETYKPFFPANTQEDTGVTAGLKAVGNVPSSAIELGKNIASAISHPIKTLSGIGETILGTIRTGIKKTTGLDINPSQAGQEASQMSEQFGKLLVDRYGSLENLQRTATNDPIGFGSDVFALLSGGAGIAGKTALLEKTAETIAKPVISTTKALIPDVNKIAIRQMDKALQLNPSDIRILEKPNVAGKNPSEWLLERGIKGDQRQIMNQLEDVAINSRTSVDEGLKNISQRYSGADVEPAKQILSVLKETFGGVPGNESLVKKLDSLLAQNDYSLSEMNSVKRLADQELNIYSRAGDIKAGALSRGLGNLRDQLKTTIENKATENGFESVKELNKETQISTGIGKAIKKRLNVSDKNVEFGLRDGLLAVSGLVATGGNFITTAGLIISKKVLESPSFRTFLANKLYKLPTERKSALINALNNGETAIPLNFIASSINEFQNAQE